MFYTPNDRPAVLKHDPFKAIIAPRPIGWISTLSKSGVANLAPYSFFNAVGSKPPLLMFSSEGWKDSAINARETGEFVFNYVSQTLADEMNATSVPAPSGVSEFEHLGIDTATSNLVAPPRVAKAYAALECKVTQIIEATDIEETSTGAVLVFGQVVGVHLDETVIKDGRFDVELANPVTRLGYLDFGLIHGLHEMPRPQWKE